MVRMARHPSSMMTRPAAVSISSTCWAAAAWGRCESGDCDEDQFAHGVAPCYGEMKSLMWRTSRIGRVGQNRLDEANPQATAGEDTDPWALEPSGTGRKL